MMFWKKGKGSVPVKVTRGFFLKPDPVTEDDILYDVDELTSLSSPATEEAKCVRILDLLARGQVRLKDLPRLMKLPGVTNWWDIQTVVEALEREGRVIRIRSSIISIMIARAKITYER